MRILVATDQPYWQRRGGAEQRICSLLNGLKQLSGEATGDASLTLGTFFLGTPADLPDEASESLSSSQSSTSSSPVSHCTNSLLSELLLSQQWFCPRLKAEASILNRLQAWIPLRRKSLTSDRQGSVASGLTINDYRWLWVLPEFRKAVKQFQPDVVLLEYVTMVYLREAVDDSTIVWALDTHDRLAERCRQFREAGQVHWLQIDAQEEIGLYRATDLLIAISEADQWWMKEMLPDQPVVVATHGCSAGSTIASVGQVAAEDNDTHNLLFPRFGFIASDNFPNRDAIDFLLDQVWPSLLKRRIETPPQSSQQGNGSGKLLIAGAIGEYVSRKSLQPNVAEQLEICGRVDSLDEFYSRIDVALSPMMLGTGLKIKTSEAVAYGKPVIASTHSAQEFIGKQCGVIVADSENQWVDAITKLTDDVGELETLQNQAKTYAKELAGVKVYDRLVQVLRQMVEAKRST